MPKLPKLRPLIDELENLHREMLALVEENLPALKRIQPESRLSAANLLHYLALLRRDVRGVQEQLAGLGLSSLGRTETHVMSGLRAVCPFICSLSIGSGPTENDAFRKRIEVSVYRNDHK